MNRRAHKEHKINMDYKKKQIILDKLFRKNSVRKQSLQAALKDTSEVMVQDFDRKNVLELQRLKDTLKNSLELQETSANKIKREITTLNHLQCIWQTMTNVLELMRKAPNDPQFFTTELKNIEAGMKKVLRETESTKSIVDADYK